MVLPPPPEKKKISRDPSFSHYLGGPSPPPQKKISRDPSFSHYLGGPSPKKNFLKRSQLFPLGVLPPPQKKKISRDPSFSHYRGGPSPLQKKKFSRDPTFFHYLGVPSPEIPAFPTILGVLPPSKKSKKKNLKKSYFFPLFWGPFSKNFLQRSHFFPLSWGSTSKKKKTKKTSGLGLILLYVVWYLSKILRGHIVPLSLRSPLSPLSSFVYLI